MDLFEKKISGETIYKGKIITVELDKVELPNGKVSHREVVRHPGGVGIVAIDQQKRVAMVRQYRYAFSEELLEIPAGKREKGEEPSLTAQRELYEEVGAKAKKWKDLGDIIASPGCYDERLYLYMATDLSLGDMHLDEDEFLNVEWIPLQTLYNQVMDGTIKDGKSVIAILKVSTILQNENLLN